MQGPDEVCSEAGVSEVGDDCCDAAGRWQPKAADTAATKAPRVLPNGERSRESFTEMFAGGSVGTATGGRSVVLRSALRPSVPIVTVGVSQGLIKVNMW